MNENKKKLKPSLNESTLIGTPMNPQNLNSFPIVGIGASAGGLTALEAFFPAIPKATECGMAFVIVQHLSPDYKSILSELIKRYTPMEVHEVTDGMRVECNNIYIIPPNRDMAFINGRLILTEPVNQRGHRLPIDFFFRSLAIDQQERAICVVLSGTGTDGTLGARAIKGEGGLVIAQKPASTEYDGMPQSIITNGLADYILTPEDIPAVLHHYTTYSLKLKPLSDDDKSLHPDFLHKIFNLMRIRNGHDFSHYKSKTILRRLERRMSINQIDSLENYFAYLQQNAAEIDLLFHDFLIGVTNFFRDPPSFEALQNKTIPLLFADKPEGSIIRVWVSACSTGEEAYSIAILLYEYCEKMARNYTIQIFATDIDPNAIEHARAGYYACNIAADVTPERITRFFNLSADKQTYQIRKNIRELIVFSEHDLIKDPPFSRMDFISCRNMLIYLKAELQKKIIPMFHYSLNEQGILFLGSSESIGEFTEMFHPINKNWKIYQRFGEQFLRTHDDPQQIIFKKPIEQQVDRIKNVEKKTITFREIAETILLKQYAPAAVIINKDGNALYFHGRTGKYLEPAPGDAKVQLIKMAREGLHQHLVRAIHKATVKKEKILIRDIKVKTNGDFTSINLIVEPIAISQNRAQIPEEALYIVIFEDVPAPFIQPTHTMKQTKSNEELFKTIAALEMENRNKEEYLQSTVEEMETSTEELKSTNEELQSVNEELQSTNEELETSREELQSINEELSTVNAELQNKILHLAKAENDLNNLLSSTGVGTIFVDLDMMIKRYTPTVTKIIKLIKSDLGRPISDIVTNLVNYENLTDDIQEVLDTLIPLEKEVQGKNDTFYSLRILPYRTIDNLIDGAVISFIDISTLKQAETVLHENEILKRLTAVVKDANDAINVIDLAGNITAWNPASVKMYGYRENEALKMKIYDLIPEEHKKESQNAYSIMNNVLRKPFKTQRICKDGSIKMVLVMATALIDENGVVYAISNTEKEEIVT